MSLVIPRPFRVWPKEVKNLSPSQIVRAYTEGLAGCGRDDDASARFDSMMEWPNGEDAAHHFGLADSAAGELVIPFTHILRLYPGCLPGPAQDRGDCVSHNEKNALLTVHCCDIVANKPDEETGRFEGTVEIAPQGVAEGVFSTEAIYWWRRHGGDGWSCEAAANVAIKESGAWIRQNYPELGVDLTSYSGSMAGKYGRSIPPENFQAQGVKNLARQATRLESFEAIRDYLKSGYGIGSCGSEGFSRERDANGVSNRSGKWAHAMAILGADDRPEIKAVYSEPLLLIQNSWSVFNQGPRRILGTNIDIPEGSFWARWSDVKNRRYIAHSSINGWPRRDLPNWLGGWK